MKIVRYLNDELIKTVADYTQKIVLSCIFAPKKCECNFLFPELIVSACWSILFCV